MSRGLKSISKKSGLKKASPKNKAYVAIVLDRSSSMSSIRKETIDMFNEQVAAIKEKSSEVDTRVTLVTFSTYVDKVTMLHEKARFLRKLKWSDYHPRGWTALNDALGATLTEFLDHRDYDTENASFLIIVISDGYENKSVDYENNEIADLVEEFEDGNGTITYLGANVDHFQIMDTYNFKYGNVGVYCSNPDGVSDASTSLRYATSNFLSDVSKGIQKTNSFYVGTTVSIDENKDKNTSNLTVTEKKK